jgi:hypothetical protein
VCFDEAEEASLLCPPDTVVHKPHHFPCGGAVVYRGALDKMKCLEKNLFFFYSLGVRTWQVWFSLVSQESAA